MGKQRREQARKTAIQSQLEAWREYPKSPELLTSSDE
jgi:hypothetical protein